MKRNVLLLIICIIIFQLQLSFEFEQEKTFLELKKPLNANDLTLNEIIEEQKVDDSIPNVPRHFDSALVLFYNRVWNQSNGAFAELDVWGNSANCYQCQNIKLLKKLNGTLMQSYIVSTQYPFTFEIRHHASSNISLR